MTANSLVLKNTLESVLEAAGYPPDHAVTWAEILLRQVQSSTADNTLTACLIRHAPVTAVREAIAEMAPHIAALCYARLAFFGMTEAEIKRLMPEVSSVH